MSKPAPGANTSFWLPKKTKSPATWMGLPSGPAPVGAEVRISNLSVFLNDYDVTVTIVLFGAVPDSLHESIHTGIAAHVRYYVELWQYTRMGVDRRLQARMVERQLTYNVLTKDYKVAPLKGETREPSAPVSIAS